MWRCGVEQRSSRIAVRRLCLLEALSGRIASPCATSPSKKMRQTNPRISLGDVPGLEVQVAINLAKNRVEWKRNRPSRRC